MPTRQSWLTTTYEAVRMAVILLLAFVAWLVIWAPTYGFGAYYYWPDKEKYPQRFAFAVLGCIVGGCTLGATLWFGILEHVFNWADPWLPHLWLALTFFVVHAVFGIAALISAMACILRDEDIRLSVRVMEEHHGPTKLQFAALFVVLALIGTVVAWAGVVYEAHKNCHNPKDPSESGYQFCIPPQAKTPAGKPGS